jgi:hypothetical protein
LDGNGSNFLPVNTDVAIICKGANAQTDRYFDPYDSCGSVEAARKTIYHTVFIGIIIDIPEACQNQRANDKMSPIDHYDQRCRDRRHRRAVHQGNGDHDYKITRGVGMGASIQRGAGE